MDDNIALCGVRPMKAANLLGQRPPPGNRQRQDPLVHRRYDGSGWLRLGRIRALVRDRPTFDQIANRQRGRGRIGVRRLFSVGHAEYWQ